MTDTHDVFRTQLALAEAHVINGNLAEAAEHANQALVCNRRCLRATCIINQYLVSQGTQTEEIDFPEKTHLPYVVAKADRLIFMIKSLSGNQEANIFELGLALKQLALWYHGTDLTRADWLQRFDYLRGLRLPHSEMVTSEVIQFVEDNAPDWSPFEVS